MITEPRQMQEFAALVQAWEEKQYALCIPALSKAKLLLAQDPRRAVFLAKIAATAGQGRLERALWRWGLSRYPKDVELLCGLAGAYQSCRRLVDAKELLQRAEQLAASPEAQGRVWEQLAGLFGQMRLFRFAEESLAKAREKLGSSAALYEEGYLRLQQERYVESNCLLTEALAREPGREDIYIMLAGLSIQQHDWAKAKEWLAAGIKGSPQSPNLLYHYAVSQWLMGEQAAFLDTVAKVEALSPKAEYIPFLYWLIALNFYAKEEWDQVKAALGKGFIDRESRPLEAMSLGDFSKPQARALIKLEPQIQGYNRCVPCAISIILNYYGVEMSQLELGQELLEGIGTPTYKLHDWLREKGYAAVTFFADQEKVKTALRGKVPLLMFVHQPGEAHVVILCGFDDGLGVYFVRDPSSLFIYPLPYTSFDLVFQNSSYEAIALVPGEEKEKLYPLQSWDEPDLWQLAQYIRALQHAEEGSKIIVEVRQRVEKPCFAQLLVNYYPRYTGESDFREAAAQLWKAPQQSNYFRLRVIHALINNESYQEAADYMKSLPVNDLNWYGKFLQAKLALCLHNDQTALDTLQKVIRLNPQFSEALVLMGQANMFNGEYHLAEEYFHWALEFTSDKGYLYALIGENCRRQRLFDQAEKSFQLALACAPEDFRTWEYWGLSWLDQSQYSKAAECFQASIKLAPNRVWGYQYLALTYEEWPGYLSEGTYWLWQGLASAGHHPELLTGIGRILTMEAIEKVSTFFSEDPEATYWFANIAFERAEYRKALLAFEKLFGLSEKPEKKAYALAMQGYCLVNMRKVAAAKKRFQKALNLDIMQEIAAANLSGMCLFKNRYRTAYQFSQPIIAGGRGTGTQDLIQYFLTAALALGLPGEQKWLDLARRRLQNIKNYSDGDFLEKKNLLKRIHELAFELGDTEVLQELRPNRFQRARAKFSVFIRSTSSKKLISLSIYLVFALELLLVLYDIIIYSKIQPVTANFFILTVILAVLLLSQIRWIVYGIMLITLFVAVCAVMLIPTLGVYLLGKDILGLLSLLVAGFIVTLVASLLYIWTIRMQKK